MKQSLKILLEDLVLTVNPSQDNIGQSVNQVLLGGHRARQGIAECGDALVAGDGGEKLVCIVYVEIGRVKQAGGKRGRQPQKGLLE